ncbi:TRAFAC clade GTPase domain-containing protein [Nocardiopsis lucentensis]|uniref:TRAFAC clade GTPase domain-containing protein n=1 Tax=Nocardiopsis lucentensis TaxID=53441 RepID=UPI00034B9B48|nr:hypothetical protein [Nocardiopsis lucentensis]
MPTRWFRSRRDDGDGEIATGCGGLIAAVIVIAVVAYFWRIIVAALVSAIIVLGACALVVGLVVVVWLYFTEVFRVMFTAEPEEPEPGPGQDPAHLAYHGGPAWYDLREIVGNLWGTAAAWSLLLVPHLLPHAVVVAAHVALTWVAVGVLRVVDTGLLLVRGVRMVCPHCYHRLGYPAYQCVHCGRRHARIRPGRRGVVRRTCLCGTRMPTLLLLGSADLNATCPHCDRALEHRPGEAREFVLPLFGGTGAGKTRLMHGLNLTLSQATEETPDAYVESVGEEARHRLRDSATVLSPAVRTSPTPPGREVRGMTVRVGVDRRTLMVQLFDAAGERFNRSDTAEGLTYLGKASTFVLAVDPLAIESVWRSLSADERDRLAGDRSHTRDPELAYEQVLEEIERQYRMVRRRTRSARLAVVVTRGDLVGTASVAPGEEGVDVWARDALGLANLLRSANAHFGTVRVFLTSSVTDTSGRADASLGELLRWTLEEESEVFTSLLDPAGAPAEGGVR